MLNGTDPLVVAQIGILIAGVILICQAVVAVWRVVARLVERRSDRKAEAAVAERQARFLENFDHEVDAIPPTQRKTA